MRRAHRLTTIVAALAALPLMLAFPACQDSQSVAEREAKAKIDEAIAQASKALPGGMFLVDDESTLAAAVELKRIAQGLGSLQGASPGQKSASLMLASSLNREAAALELRVVGDLEQSHRSERLAVQRAASAAAGLESLAVPLERVDFASARTALKSQRDQAETQLRQLQSEIKALEGAISQVDRQIATSQSEASRLELDADRLRLEARSLTPRQALPLIEQASEIQRQNAAVRGALGRQQSEKGAIEPQLAGAKALGSGGTAVLEVTDDAMKQLQTLAEAARDAANRAKKGASDVRGAGKTRLEAVLASMSESLEPRYQAAIEALERSATLASQAAGGTDAEGGDSARIAAAGAEMALARALWQRASAMEDHAALLRRLDAAGGWGQSSQLGAAIAAVDASKRESSDRAKELYGTAIETLGQLRSPSRMNSAEVAGLLTQAQRAQKELTQPGSGGADVAASNGASDDGTVGGSTDGGSGGGSTGGGAESPDALIAQFSKTPENADETRARFALLHTKQFPELLSAMESMSLALEPVREASVKKFGSAPDFAGGGGAGAGSGLSLPTDVKLLSQDDTSATIEFKSPHGMHQGKLIMTDGRWMLDFDSMLEAAAPGQAAMLASMAPMFATMTKAMQTAANSVASRIDAGEFTTPEEALAALQAELAAAMQAAMGSGGGM